MITYRELAMYTSFFLSGLFSANAGWHYGREDALVGVWMSLSVFMAAVALAFHEGGSKK